MTQALVCNFDHLETGASALVRVGRPERTAMGWSTPFQSRLYLQRDAKGRVCCLALMDRDWAEYDPRQAVEADGTFSAEDYYLQVLEILEPAKG